MFCPNCGSEVKDDDLFCGECGAKIERTEVPESEPVKKEAAPQSESVRTAAGFSDKAKKIIIAEIAVLVVLIAAFFYLGNKKAVQNQQRINLSKIITAKDGQRSMICIILKKIHLSIKKPMSRLWNKVRQRHYLHQLEDIRNMELMQDSTSTRRKRFRHDNDPCSKISKEEFLIL